MSDGPDIDGKPFTAGAGHTPPAAGEWSTKELPPLERKARIKFAQQVYSRCRGKRDAEGEFNGDTMKWEPTSREDEGHTPPRPARVHHFRSWSHIYRLCMRALEGHDVPPDIAKYRDELWPKVHAAFFENAVETAEKAASDAHEKQQRMAAKRAKLLAEAAVKESRDYRIKQAEERVAGYNASIAKLEAKVKALETQKKRALRSIAALKRFAEKEAKS